MRYDSIFISAGLICVLAGMSFGLWMGGANDFTLAPAHAHLNLVGWVTLSLYGLMHRAFPALSSAKLAPFQCGLAIIGAVTMPIGIGIAITSGNTNETPVIVASMVVLFATLLFAIMFFGKVTFAKAS